MADLDNILSGRSEAAPATDQVEEQVTQVQAEDESQQQEQTEAPGEQGEQPHGQKMVPHEALHAEKQKVKRYTEQIASFEQTIKERDAAWERRFGEMLEKLAPKQEPQQKPDWFENPDAALEARLGQTISPLAHQVSTLQTQILRMSAEQAFGPEKVQAFEAYVAEAMSRGDPEMATLGAQMRASADPMKTGLEWFEKRTFDPAKERERIKSEILAELQQQGGQQPQRAVLPSNLAGVRNVGARSGPAWSGPSPLQDIFDRRPPSG